MRVGVIAPPDLIDIQRQVQANCLKKWVDGCDGQYLVGFVSGAGAFVRRLPVSQFVL